MKVTFRTATAARTAAVTGLGTIVIGTLGLAGTAFAASPLPTYPATPPPATNVTLTPSPVVSATPSPSSPVSSAPASSTPSSSAPKAAASTDPSPSASASVLGLSLTRPDAGQPTATSTSSTLPFTGLDVAAIAVVGGALVTGGTVLLVSSRKRQSTIV